MGDFVLFSRERDGDRWILETTEGEMPIRFVEKNAFGVADHYVVLASGQEVCNPIRVLVNGDGSEVVFTLFQPADMPDERFAVDSGMVRADLETLKWVLEKRGE